MRIDRRLKQHTERVAARWRERKGYRRLMHGEVERMRDEPQQQPAHNEAELNVGRKFKQIENWIFLSLSRFDIHFSRLFNICISFTGTTTDESEERENLP